MSMSIDKAFVLGYKYGKGNNAAESTFAFYERCNPNDRRAQTAFCRGMEKGLSEREYWQNVYDNLRKEMWK